MPLGYNTFNPDDYSGDVQNAVSAARFAGGAVVLSPKIYNLNSKIKLDWNGASIGCLIAGAKAILNVSGTSDAIELGGSLIDQCVHDLKITSPSPRISGGSGIVCEIGTTRDQTRIENVFIEKQYFGAKLDAIGLGYIRDLTVVTSVSHGIYLYNTLAAPMQWNFYGRNLVAANGGTGFLIQANPNFGPISVGDVHGISSYANGAYGAAFIGASNAPLQGVRFRDFFLGADANDCLFMDTYGEQHAISNGYIEASGLRGFYGTANNRLSNITNLQVRDCNRMGIAYSGNDSTFTNCHSISNGRAGISPYGAWIEGSRNQIIGGRFSNQIGIATQDWGIVFSTISNHQAIGTNTIGNNIGGITGSYTGAGNV